MEKQLQQNKASLIVIFLTLIVFVTAQGIFASANAGPKEQLQKSVDEILKILQSEELKRPEKKAERKKLILDVVTDMFDFKAMARSSLGKNWRSLSKEDQDKFVGLFTDLVEERYVGKIDSYENQKVVYNKQLVRGDKAMIYTAIVDKDLDIPIVYRLEENNGKWLVNDLKIENVSLIVNYRRDFDSIMRREQFAGLVKKIEEQLEKYENAN